jgi:tripartite ATP-independent transporter DctP family solute receptor
MKETGKGIVLLALFTFFLLGAEIQAVGAANPEITLRYAGSLPIDSHTTHSMYFYAKLVEEKTKGKVKIDVFPAGQLFTDKDMLRAVPSGAVDMAQITPLMWTGAVPVWIVLDLFLFYTDRAHWNRVMDSEAGEILKQELLDRNVGAKVLYWMDGGTTSIASKVPIKKLEDFKGKRIRAGGESVVNVLKALGAAPVFMGGGEVYMALQRGTVDAAHAIVTSLWLRKYNEVTKHLICPEISYMSLVTVINKKKWESLTGDVQKAMLEAGKEADLWTRKECTKDDQRAVLELKEKGMEVFDPPEQEKARWREAIRPLWDEYKTRGGEKVAVWKEIAEKVR